VRGETEPVNTGVRSLGRGTGVSWGSHPARVPGLDFHIDPAQARAGKADLPVHTVPQDFPFELLLVLHQLPELPIELEDVVASVLFREPKSFIKRDDLLTDASVKAVDLEFGPEPRVVSTRGLFSLRPPEGRLSRETGTLSFHPDRGFVMMLVDEVESPGGESGSARTVLVVNWFRELRELVGN